MTLGLSESFLREVGTIVEKTAYASTILWQLSQEKGNVVRTTPWKSDYSEWTYGSNSPGFISLDSMENSPDIASGLTETNATLLGLFGKMVLSPAQVATMQNSAIGVNITPAELIANQLHAQFKARESMLACGQAGRYLDAADPLKKATTAGATYIGKGLLFNSAIQTIAGGIGEDNNMTAFGDYFATMVKIEQTMNDGGVDTSDVHVLMDTATFADMKSSLSTNIFEWNQIINSFPTWKFYGTNHPLAYGLTTNKYIWAVSPKDAQGQSTYKVVESVPFGAAAVCGGQLTPDLNYQWGIGGKFGVIVKNGYGIVKTGALTE